MSVKNNAICSVCGKEYYICPDTQRSKINPWRSITESINCYKIHLVLSDYTNGYTDAYQTAQNLKKNCDLSQKDSFLPNIKKTIDDLLEMSKKENKCEKKKNQKEK